MSAAEPLPSHDVHARRIAEALGGATFPARTLGSDVHHGSTEQPDAFTTLFDGAGFARLVSTMPLQPPRIRMYHEVALDPGRYMQVRQTRTELTYVAPDPDKVRSRLEEGATLVIGMMDGLVPALGDTRRALQWWLRCPIDTTGYLVHGATRGFSPHVDDFDVVAVQLEGSKNWGLWEPTRAHPLQRDVARPQRPDTDPRWITMKAGDVLYLPRGTWHTAETSDPDGVSTHLAMVLRRRTGIDWVGFVADRLRSSERFRADLPVFTDDAHAASHARALADELTAVARDADWTTFVDHDLTTAEVPPVGDLVTVPVSAARSVRFVTPFRPVISDDSSGAVCEAGARRLRFDSRCRPILDVLAGGGWVHVADLPCEDLPDRALPDTLAALASAGLIQLR
jgi:hypothetical protein